jgi:hypothetical protein
VKAKKPRLSIVRAALALVVVTLWGCHAQNPYSLWGPSKVPPPSQAQTLPYYPPGTSLGSSTHGQAGTTGSSGTAQGSRTAASTSRQALSRSSQGESLAEQETITIEPEDRQPIRVVENNPRPAVEISRLPGGSLQGATAGQRVSAGEVEPPAASRVQEASAGGNRPSPPSTPRPATAPETQTAPARQETSATPARTPRGLGLPARSGVIPAGWTTPVQTSTEPANRQAEPRTSLGSDHWKAR